MVSVLVVNIKLRRLYRVPMSSFISRPLRLWRHQSHHTDWIRELKSALKNARYHRRGSLCTRETFLKLRRFSTRQW